MGKFRKKLVVVEASQWFKNGDHPEDGCEIFHTKEGKTFYGEGKVVRSYRHPKGDGEDVCLFCNSTMHVHGWIDTLEGDRNVCVGDWIITEVKGEYYPCKPAIFEMTFEKID